jgi:hypothetical protein
MLRTRVRVSSLSSGALCVLRFGLFFDVGWALVGAAGVSGLAVEFTYNSQSYYTCGNNCPTFTAGQFPWQWRCTNSVSAGMGWTQVNFDDSVCPAARDPPALR